jgi:hypothetical protein
LEIISTFSVEAALPDLNERCTSGIERTLHFRTERTLHFWMGLGNNFYIFRGRRTTGPERTLHFWNRPNAALPDLNERCTSGIERTLYFWNRTNAATE